MNALINAHRPLVAVSIGCLWVGITGLNLAILPSRYASHVRVETVQTAPLPLMVRAPATLEPKKSLTFKAEFDAPVLAKHFVEGEAVQNGALLIELSRERVQLDYESKSDAVKNAQADLIRAEKDEKLQKALYKRQAVSLSSVEDAKRAYVRAVQALRNAQVAFRLEQEIWNKNKFFAPFSGTVIKDFIGNDPIVSSGKEIVTLADVSGYSVRARVDELEIGQVHEGQKAQVSMEVISNTSLPAHVSQIGGQSDENGPPEVLVDLLLENSEGLALRPKLSAEVRILTGQTPPVLSVPLTAIANEDGQPKVWVLTNSNRLKSQRIVVGKANPDRVEITQGLQAGDRICIQSDPHFTEGMKVTVDK